MQPMASETQHGGTDRDVMELYQALIAALGREPTREEYIQANWGDNPPEPGEEMEEQIPPSLRKAA